MSKTDKLRKPLPRKEWDRLEEIIERFEAAWQGGQRPAIDDYLKPGDTEPRKLLLELVHAELECRLKAGEDVRVETYFERYPQIGGDPEVALGLIVAEYNLRRRREPNLTPQDYERRFPEYRQELPARLLPLRQRECLPTHLSCPHCHKPIPISASAGEKQLTCSSCGGSFRFDLAHSPAWSPLALPRLGQFELLKEIGQGGFGTVYRARDADLGRIVAVKVPRVGWLTPADQDRFVREARNAAQLAHTGIVPVYEVGRGGPVPYIVSAYVEGMTLAKALMGRRFGFREAAEVIAQVAEALDHAHRHGVVHRDLKPSNIMLGRLEGTAPAVDNALPEETPSTAGAAPSDKGGEVHAFVMDFGLSRREEGEITVTMEGQILGTPAYMSPEQARGEGHHVDGRSDVYSLGVILYELLTGEIPFRGVTRMVLQQIQLEEPRVPRRLNDKIPRDLETITLKCMAKEPARRYQTAGEVAADLRRHLNGQPIQARPVTQAERFWRWCCRNPVVAGLTAAAALFLLAGTGISSYFAIQANHRAEEANQNLELALDTLKSTVYEVAEGLRDKPGMYKLMQNLLDPALANLDQVLHSARAADANTYMAAAHQRLGDIFFDLGKMAEARQHYQRANALAKEVIANHPERSGARRNLGIINTRLGIVAYHLGDLTASREYYHKALEIAQALAEAAPGDAEALRDLLYAHSRCGDANRDIGDPEAALRHHRMGLEFARAAAEVEPQSTDTKRALADGHDKIGEVLLESGDFEAAREHFGKALPLREAVAAAEPESRRAVSELALAHQRIGLVHQRLVNLPEALEHATKGVELREKLVAADPQDARAQRHLVLAYGHLAEVHKALGGLSAVREDHRKSLQIARELAAADPNDIIAQTDLAATYFNLGANEKEARDYEEAAKWIDQGVALLQRLQAQGKLKEQAFYQRLLAQRQQQLTVCRAARRAIDDLDFALAQPPAIATDLLVIRATALASRGQHVSAAVTAEKLRALDPTTARNAYNVACMYALCVSGVGQGKTAEQLTPEETATRKSYVARALELLATAVQLGYKDMVKIETDPDLAAIRQEEGYRTLLAHLKTPTTKPK